MKQYKSSGYVYGNLWGGGKVAYKAEPIFVNSKEELLKKAKVMLEDGTLDSGMGYQSLIGAILFITETETIQVKDKDFQHLELEVEFIGKLTDEEKEFLESLNLI